MRRFVTSLLILAAAQANALEPTREGGAWPQLSLGTCGVDRFADALPEADGRGVVIAVLDTGVEVNAPGLLNTPDGSPKIIDVQDFSGEGDLYYNRAEEGPSDGEATLRGPKGEPFIVRLPSHDVDLAGREIFYTFLDESKFTNSNLSDFDGDGKSESRVAILIFKTQLEGELRYVAMFDTNGDRSFEDEEMIADFNVRQDSVRLTSRIDPDAASAASIAVNIMPADRKLSIHFDSGGHGTHVAGIAAGYELGGQPDFNGVAPGAQVISLKIGDGRQHRSPTSSGSKLEAIKYAARYSRENKVPVVVNISYGLHAEREGATEIDTALEKILRDNPNLTVCVSAGNSGPGLSTIGTPASAPSAFTIGAVTPPETARETRGTVLPTLPMAPFSSRGAEVTKPEISTPGVASSSVPFYAKGNDVYAGTSMASPYAAGLCARLISGAIQEYDDELWPTRDSIKRALMSSAILPEGETVLDAGRGVPDMPTAWEALGKLVSRQRGDDPSAIEVETDAPDGDGVYPAAVFRGTIPPDEPQKFTVRAAFSREVTQKSLQTFHRRYFVSSKSTWATPVQESIYLREKQSATVLVRYDAAALQKPGLYIADIEVREEGTPTTLAPEAVLRTVVIVPERFTAANNYQIVWSGQIARDSYRYNRHFLHIPPWASAVRFALEAPDQREHVVSASSLYLPDGRSKYTGLTLAKDAKPGRVEWTLDDTAEAGVVELPVAERTGEKSGPYTLTATLLGVAISPSEIAGTWKSEGSAKVSFTAQNLLDVPQRAKGEIVLDALTFEDTAKLGGEDLSDRCSHSIVLGSRYRGLRVKIEFPREDYLALTDASLAITDGRGKRLVGGSMETREQTIEYIGAADQLNFELQGAFADKWNMPELAPKLTFDLLLANPVSGTVSLAHSEGNTLPLFPGTLVDLSASLSGFVPDLGSRNLTGKLTLKDTSDNIIATAPVRLSEGKSD